VASLLNLKEIKEAKEFIVNTLHDFKDDVKSVASNISAKDITALGTSPGPAVILSVGLPLIDIYLAKKKYDSPLIRKIARFLGADVNSINEQLVFDKLNNTEYYDELRKKVLSVITERGDISPLTKMLDLTEGEAWEIFNTIKEIIFSAEVLNQFSIIVPSLKNIEKEVGNVRRNLGFLLEALKSPIRVSRDVYNIANELSILESAGVSYVRRDEDSELEQAILNSNNKIILIIGEPGSGKSKMLYNALMYCREYFSTYILLKDYFREGDEKSLDLALAYDAMDNFVVIWDDLHEKNPDFIIEVIERINNISRPKNFRFLGASRKQIFVKGEAYRLNLHRFDKIGELVSECTNAFNVDLKIERDIANNKMLSKGDGTPYYTISLFKIFKGRSITLRDLDQLPSDVTNLWRRYLDETIQNSRINTNDLNAFRSLGLISHSSETSWISKDKIYEVYDSVFHGDLGGLDYALDDLVKNMLVSQTDEGYYYAHDSHIEALESKYPIEKYHVQNFTKYESNSRILWTFENWAYYNWKMEYCEMISSRILQLNHNDVNAWKDKAYALSQLARYDEAIIAYDKILELNPNNIFAHMNKGLVLSNLNKFEEAIKYFDKALELSQKVEEPYVMNVDRDADIDKHTGQIKPGVYNLQPNPNWIAVWFYKAYALSQLARYDEAIAAYDKILELDEYDIDALVHKAYALSQLARYEEEVMCYNKVLKLYPNHVHAWYKRASSNIKQKNVENGLASLKKAIKIDKKYIEIAKQDKDFESLRNDERFKALTVNENRSYI
jgi:tetratricopeptide (TPR) repeat protein